MKIFFVAPFCFGLEESMSRSFTRAGACVQSIIYGKTENTKNTFKGKVFDLIGYGLIKKVKKAASKIGIFDFIKKRTIKKFNNNFLNQYLEFKPDIVFIVKGEIFFLETLLEVKKKSKLVAYYWDDPFLRYAKTIGGGEDIRYRNVIRNFSEYDYTFVYDPSYIDELKKGGAKEVFDLLDWYEPELYKPISLNNDELKLYGADVSFVGSPYPTRVELLNKLQNFNLGVWGPLFMWKEFFGKYPKIKEAYRGEAHGSISAKIYNASKINLNLHDKFQCIESVNNRTFQILACSGFEIVDDRKKIHELFKVGEEIETFMDATDLVKKIEYYLSKDDLRNKIKAKGYEKSPLHSVDVRVKRIFDVLT